MRVQVERLTNLSLKRSFFLLATCGLLVAVVLAAALGCACVALSSRYPAGGVTIGGDGVVTPLPQPTAEQMKLLRVLGIVPLVGYVLFPAAGLAVAGAFFYRLKLKEPIRLLSEGTARIRAHDLDFTIPRTSGDELGALCGAFETMRAELLRTNRELWRQAEERKRINAAFAHDLRNPITVLKGSVQLLRRDPGDGAALDRLETYTARLERYVEAMSSIQRLEQLPLEPREISLSTLARELAETARLLAPGVACQLCAPEAGTCRLDQGAFLTVAENLLSNAGRYARAGLEVTLAWAGETLTLTVADDGPGYPEALLREGPKPFGRADETGEGFGMGLYSCALLCAKHGGGLCLSNTPGATAVATFSTRA